MDSRCVNNDLFYENTLIEGKNVLRTRSSQKYFVIARVARILLLRLFRLTGPCIGSGLLVRGGVQLDKGVLRGFEYGRGVDYPTQICGV